MEPEKKKSRKDVRDSNLYLEDNIMSFECKGNDPQCIQYITEFFHVRFQFVRLNVGYAYGPIFGNLESPNQSRIQNDCDSPN